MACSVRGITNSVVSEDKNKTESTVRKAVKSSAIERAIASNDPLAFLVEVIKKTEPTLDGEKVHVLNLSGNPKDGFTMKYKVGKSNKVLEVPVENFSIFMSNTPKFRIDTKHLNMFYSDFESINTYDDYEAMALDITNNPERIVEVAQDLVDADEYHNDEEHNSVLFNQLNLIKDSLVRMVPNLNVHINNAGKANFGEINVKTNDMYISKGVGGSKSLLEIYVHELYHAVTHYAINSTNTEMRGFVSRMEKIRNNFLKNTTETDLVKMSGGTLTVEQAGKVLDHLTDPKVGLHEFVALSMSNKAVMNQLKTLDITDIGEPKQSLFYRLLDLVYEAYNAISRFITKEPQGDDLARMVFLVGKLHHANKKPLEARRLLGIRNLLSIGDKVDSKIAAKLDKMVQKAKDDPEGAYPKQGEGKVKYGVRLAVRSFYDATARDIIGNTLSLATIKGGYNPFRPEGTVRTIIRDSFESDWLQDKVEQLGMVSQTIDQQREFRAIQTAEVVLSSFTRALTAEEEVTLTNTILDTDLSSIFYNYDVLKLLKSNKAIEAAEGKILEKLKELADEKVVNYYGTQAELLARYMINHEDHIALLKNAENIAMMLGTPLENRDVSKEVVNLIDELATLKALKKVSIKDKKVLMGLMDEQPTGVNHLVAFQFGQKDYSERLLFPTPADRINIIKGYSAQITDPDIDITIAPAAKNKEMEAQGYVLKEVLGKHTLDGNITPMALYVNNRFMQKTFHRVGLRMTDKARRGSTVTESYAMSGNDNPTLRASIDIKKMRARQQEVVKLMLEGKYNFESNADDMLVSPVLNATGKIKDFSYGMDKQVKIDLLDMERKVSVVMGRTAASTYDKAETEKFNQQVMALIEEDAAKNASNKSVIGKNQKEYIRINKDSTNELVQDLWKILPTDIKKKYPEGFTLRRDLMMSYLGFRDMGVSDLPGFKQFFGGNEKAYQRAIKYALDFAEKLWQELIKISKADIIIRTPGVFIGNVVSNFMLMYVSGYSFKEITTLKYQGVKELSTYVEGLKKSMQLEAKQNANIITKAELRELDVIKNNLINSPVKDLVDEGFYTTILEEMEHGEGSGSYFNKMAKKKLNKVPQIFSDGFDLLYITENTKLFKLIEKGVQASDFAARYAQYHLLKEKGVSQEKAVKIVRDNFINYNKPNSRFLEWANRNGFVMFTKYFTRIQRVIRDYGKNHPTKLLLSILAQDYVLGEIDTFDDQSVFAKDMGNLFYNPWDNMLRVFTPSSAEAVDWLINGS